MECALPEYYLEKCVRARKEHKCCETLRVISKGEMYWRCSGKWDGAASSYCQCESAYHFARYINVKVYDDCVVGFGEITAYMDEIMEKHPTAGRIWREIVEGSRVWGPDDKMREVRYTQYTCTHRKSPHYGEPASGFVDEETGEFMVQLMRLGLDWSCGWHQTKRSEWSPKEKSS